MLGPSPSSGQFSNTVATLQQYSTTLSMSPTLPLSSSVVLPPPGAEEGGGGRSSQSSVVITSSILELSCALFYTRFECSFTSSPLVSSVVSHLLHSFRVWFHIFPTRFECSFSRSSVEVDFTLPNRLRPLALMLPMPLVRLLEARGGAEGKSHSKRVGKIWNYTRNEWRKYRTTPETSGEDVKSHSK